MKIVSALLGGALAVCAPASAQVSAPMVVGAPAGNVLRAGTEVPLKTVTELTTNGKKLKVGDRFDLEVSEPVKVNGVVVIPVGSRAIGEVTAVRNKGMWGKSGAINARVLYVRANDQQIRLSGALDDKGVTGTAGVVAAIAFVPVAGFFTTGTSAVIPPGTQVMGHTDEDVPVAFAEGVAPAPLVVPATATVPAAAVTPVALTAQ